MSDRKAKIQVMGGFGADWLQRAFPPRPAVEVPPPTTRAAADLAEERDEFALMASRDPLVSWVDIAAECAKREHWPPYTTSPPGNHCRERVIAFAKRHGLDRPPPRARRGRPPRRK